MGWGLCVKVLVTVLTSLFHPQEGHVSTVQTLVSLGANLNAEDDRKRSGTTCLYVCLEVTGKGM